uniref:SUEL-type lectin domain-containing protein n=1 Tax=Sinocyclocheilus anshuiensis TaxID=1608454 RepID=A0A671REN2_9TELE
TNTPSVLLKMLYCHTIIYLLYIVCKEVCDVMMLFFYSDSGVIHDTANYGRTDKIICSEGRPSSELQNTNCYSPNALAPVSKSCNGLESCEVFATHTVFADPCVGIYKYLTISYFCSSVICEHANNTLMCGTVIRIHSTNYGRTDSSTCSTGRPASQLAKTDCYASNSQAMTTYVCSLVASNGVFSDPCTNTFKYPYVSYSCTVRLVINRVH